MSHFVILEGGPVASPAKCGICGYGGTDRKYIDTGQDFEFYGAYIICEACVGAMANDFGFLQPHESANLIARMEASEKELLILRAAILNLEELHDALGNLGFVRGDSVPSDVAELDSAADSELPEGPVDAEGSPDRDADEQVDESGPDDLSNSDADDPFATFKL